MKYLLSSDLVNGNYSSWTKSSPCSVTCGGVEIWTRQCNNPHGKYGGNCSQGVAQKSRMCERKPCVGTFSKVRFLEAYAFYLIRY